MGATKNYLATAVAVAVLGAGFAAPAFADTTEDLLKSLRAKGVLSADEYDRLLKQEREESKNTALEQANAVGGANDTAKKAADAVSATKVSGKIYADFTNINGKESGSSTAANNVSYAGNGPGTDIKRFYIDVNHKFSDVWSADFTSDIHMIRSANDTAGTGRTDVFVKKAFLQGTFAPELFVRLGRADTAWIPYVEGLYGYRYVENTLTDKVKVANSADDGVHFGGKLANGLVNYALSAESGFGYSGNNDTYGGHTKHLDWEGRINIVPVTGLDLAIGGFVGKLGQDTQGRENTAVAGTSALKTQNATRLDLLASYVVPNSFRVGAEWFTAKNFNTTTAVEPIATALPTQKGTGFSAWGSVNITDPIAIFARFDSVKPYKSSSVTFTPSATVESPSGIKGNYFNVGVSYAATKGVDLALAFKHEQDKGINAATPGFGASNTPSLTANGAAAVGNPNAKFTINEIGLWAQAAW